MKLIKNKTFLCDIDNINISDNDQYSNKSIMNFVDLDVQQVINKLENARNQNTSRKG